MKKPNCCSLAYKVTPIPEEPPKGMINKGKTKNDRQAIIAGY
jgi:hypothetical protein